MLLLEEEGLDLRGKGVGVLANMTCRNASLARSEDGSIELAECVINRGEGGRVEVSEGGFNRQSKRVPLSLPVVQEGMSRFGRSVDAVYVVRLPVVAAGGQDPRKGPHHTLLSACGGRSQRAAWGLCPVHYTRSHHSTCFFA